MASKQWPSLAKLKKLCKKVLRKYPELKDVVIFGSFVKGKTKPEDIIWIEHYPERDGGDESFDEIEFQFDDDRFHLPEWSYYGDTMTENDMKELLSEVFVN